MKRTIEITITIICIALLLIIIQLCESIRIVL